MISEDIDSNLLALIKLSKDIPFAKIPDRIEEKKNDIIKLEKDIRILKEEKETLKIETSLEKYLRDADLAKEKTTVAELEEYSKFKRELKKYGLSIEEDIPKFVQAVYGIKQQHGYDIDKILSDQLRYTNEENKT